MPLLLNADGLPLFDAAVYTISVLRARNLAVNSIKSHLRAIQRFEVFCTRRGICFDDRLDEGRLLSTAEIDALVGECWISASALKRRSRGAANAQSDHLLAEVTDKDFVNPGVARGRIEAILRYLDWRVSDRISTADGFSDLRLRLENERQQTRDAAIARAPIYSTRSERIAREGLAPEAVARLLEVSDPRVSDNPWSGTHVRYRNALIVRWLLWLGVRRGELLAIRVPDIDFQASKAAIVRRPDNPADPRNDQPLVKTRGRELPLSPSLLEMTRNYVLNHRRHEGRAREHDFLLVSSHSGAPLSIPSCNKIFQVLRAKDPQLFKNLSAHALRHTWNDDFSKTMDQRGINEVREVKMRAYLMGWSETSGTAALYTRRHTRLRAQEVSFNMQRDAMRSPSDG